MSLLGSTNKFPQGKLDDSDEGELRMAIFVKKGKVVMDFGKEIAWLGLGKEEAKQLGELLIKKAETL